MKNNYIKSSPGQGFLSIVKIKTVTNNTENSTKDRIGFEERSS